MGFFSNAYKNEFGHKNEFETAVVSQPSVFKPLKVYCTEHKNNFCTKEHSNTFFFTKEHKNTVFTKESNSIVILW